MIIAAFRAIETEQDLERLKDQNGVLAVWFTGPDCQVCSDLKPKLTELFQQQFPRVPIVVLTGFPEVEMATEMLRLGVVDYLVKPVEGDKLKAAIAKAIEQRSVHGM